MVASPATGPTTVMDHSFFFTPQERDRVALVSVDTPPSLSAALLQPLWIAISRLVPDSVAPNSISLLGVVLVVQAYQVLIHYYESQPQTASVAASALVAISWVCAAIDGVHARRCRSGTFLGVIFSEVCYSVKHIFLALIVVIVLGIRDSVVQWYFVVGLQFARLAHTFIKYGSKVQANATKASRLFSSTEFLLVHAAIILFPSYVPVQAFNSVIREWAQPAYVVTVALCLVIAPVMRSEGTSLVPLAIVLVSRLMPSFLLPLNDLTPLTILADAVVIATLTVEVIVSSFAHRTIHSFTSVIAVLGAFNSIGATAACALYIAGMLLDLSVVTKTPLFVPIRNVYIDGVFDLCHIGHKRLMEFALSQGNRLVVGVMSDEDCVGYKRKPVMTTDERCTEVRSCRWVSEVIPGAPCNGLTEQFLKAHNIHVVVYGDEYNTPTDHYYRAARDMGIAVTAPRTPGMSTSEIIRRIASASAEDLAAKDKQNSSKKGVSC